MMSPHSLPSSVAHVFDALPSSVMVLDSHGVVVAMNEPLASMIGLTLDRSPDRSLGDVLQCTAAEERKGGCGSTQLCAACPAHSLLQRALATGETCHDRVAFKVGLGSNIRELTLPLSAAPIDLGGADGETGAVLLLGSFAEARRDPCHSSGWHGMVGEDPSMRALFETIGRVAPIDVPVLILGESGSGKELVALAVHDESPRAQNPFVPVSCAALPEGLLESELFGHVRGSFTGATRDKKGRFELADGGTIFLDEIGELSPAMQVKLLRVLQTRSFERVGGEKTISVNVRVIAATNKDLEAEVAAGRFRADLYYRLCVVPIRVPSLRERPSDVPLLADYLLCQWATAHARPPLPFSPGAMSALQQHSWPGNVRELENAVRFAMVHCRGGVIDARDLPPAVRAAPAKTEPARRFRGLDEVAVTSALRSTNGNRARAAKLLGVSRATFYRFLAERPALTN